MAGESSIEDRIVGSTLNLLQCGGPRAVTVEAVAEHSGVAKTTIYRRHPNRREMLSAALSSLAVLEAPASDMAPADRFRWVIARVVEIVEDGIGPGGFAALLTDEDPEFSAVFRQILGDQHRLLGSVLDEGATDDSLRGDLDPSAVIDAVAGSYIAERARNGAVEADWAERVFTLLWPAVQS